MFLVFLCSFSSHLPLSIFSSSLSISPIAGTCWQPLRATTTAATSQSLTVPEAALENPCVASEAPSLPTLERLAQATGGTEKSWYRCVFPFGVISLVIGMAGTGVTFKFNTLLQTKVVSVALLCAGVVMLLVAAVCWRAHRLRRRKKKEGGFFSPTALVRSLIR
uniref:Transmembrane protein 100 n=1 Tax=Dicentrarchus labrax TaxID=13489 RepID=A0A8C4GW34_DICLA